MANMHDPLFDFDARQRLEDMGDPPTRADLFAAAGDSITWDEYAALMDLYFPMTVEEAKAARSKPLLGTFDAIIARREAEAERSSADAAKGGLP